MISCLYRKKGLLERANDPSQNAYEPFCCKFLCKRLLLTCYLCLVMTHPKNGVMPLTVDAELKRLGISEESVRKIQNERAMLNLFFANFKQYDPDVIIVSFSIIYLNNTNNMLLSGPWRFCSNFVLDGTRWEVQYQNMEFHWSFEQRSST